MDDFVEFARDLQETIISQARQHYSGKVVQYWLNPQNFGRLERAEGHARITGPCGETMEIFLEVKHERITRASFLTDGCGPSLACGSVVTQLAIGKTLDEARSITQDTIIKNLGGLPDESEHCAVLAANTLAGAIHEYAARGEGDTSTPESDRGVSAASPDPRKC